MKVKELNELRRKLYEEIIKDEEVSKELRNSEQVYLYEIEEGAKHEIIVISKPTQFNISLLKDYGFSDKAYIALIYTINKKLKKVW